MSCLFGVNYVVNLLTKLSEKPVFNVMTNIGDGHPAKMVSTNKMAINDLERVIRSVTRNDKFSFGSLPIFGDSSNALVRVEVIMEAKTMLNELPNH